jgi:3-oxoadipate enol-lactonase
MPVIKVNDINMYYEVHGSGEPLVMIAGSSTDHSIFRLCINQLSLRYKVLVFDNRGAGQTDKPDIAYTIEMMANDTATLMSCLSIESAYVIGISLGGRIAMELTLKYPEKVKRLVLASTSASVKARLPFLIKLLKRVKASISKTEQPYYAFLRQLNASYGYDCSNRFSEINVPTLIMYGKKDKRVSYTQVEDMNLGIKESKLITFKRGHLFFIWENKLFIDTILEFLGS